MTKHTLGPWHVSTPPPNGEQIIGNEKGMMVAVVTTGVGLHNNTTTTLANARLIAAAPDLLEALDYVIRDLELRSNFKTGNDKGLVDIGRGAYSQAKAAIAKATGV